MRLILAALLTVLATPLMALDCYERDHNGQSYSICDVDLTQDKLRLFLRDEAGETIGSFRRLKSELDGKALLFAMNAGMYHDDRNPVGHYIEDGTQVMRVVPNAGPGNFGMLPNGVLCITADTARVYETSRFVETNPTCTHATQSGPMLLIDGDVHPRFLPDSTFRNIRNGVGTSEDGKTASFVISDTQVTFYELALFFRDVLGQKNALYFDGRVSKLHAPDLRRSDIGQQMGPIVAVVE
jgi:uncharacterized protein YigE (DUF2233 family)